MLKTSSGKIRRTACRELYEQGGIGTSPRAVWQQYARLWLAGWLARCRRFGRTVADVGYAGWVYLSSILMLPPVFLVALLPGLERRWRALSRLARGVLKLWRMPFSVEGVARLPADGRAVLVANHASYLDGLLLVAALPNPVTFVAKAELEDVPFAAWFLRRLGVRFVDRFDAERSVEDAQALSADASAGTPLLLFPEGTFTRFPGLLRFHLGAFTTAAANDLPVVPITINGSRGALRGDDWFPRRCALSVIITEPVRPPSGRSVWEAALALRDQARAQILEHLDEQDLGHERGLP